MEQNVPSNHDSAQSVTRLRHGVHQLSGLRISLVVQGVKNARGRPRVLGPSQGAAKRPATDIHHCCVST